ncbi:MAG TPA: rhomboid family intramembrane serine protease [Gemmatimonadales bacterium]|nr:rhomboid family intramembrane serine protease [Gemmatimonadales bacterium]
MSAAVAFLLAANAVVFLAQRMVPGLTEQLVLVPAAISQAPWTFITSMFAHAGFGHIFFNMFALWIFGPRVESRFGPRRFLGLYFTSGIIGNLGAFLVPGVAYLGASGAVFGVSLAYARYWPRDKFFIYGIIPMTARTMVFGYAALEFFFARSGLEPGVAHYIHLGGFLGGWLFCLVMDHGTGAAAFRRRAFTDPTRPAAHPLAAVQAAIRDRISRWDSIQADQLHPVNREELERIRAKLSSQGITALTPGDIEFLERFSGRH